MRKKRREIRPTRERFRVDHQSVKPAVLLDIGIELLSQMLEVRYFQAPHGRNNQDTLVLEQLTLNHIRHSAVV